MRSMILVPVLIGACASAPHPVVPGAENESPLQRRTRRALMKDVREVRNLRARIEAGEITRNPVGRAVIHEDFLPKEYEIFYLNAVDPNDELAVREIVMVDRQRNQYIYTYLGGPRRLNLRLGPFPLKLD